MTYLPDLFGQGDDLRGVTLLPSPSSWLHEFCNSFTNPENKGYAKLWDTWLWTQDGGSIGYTENS